MLADMLSTKQNESRSGDTAQKLGAMLGIFVLSFCASTFPTLSKRISFLRIPHTVFFILKHFGTGVILATAFVHLLQDAFETLLSLPAHSPVRHWVGLLVLSSLLAIFLVEYVSMTYVERLEGANESHPHSHGHHHHPQNLSPSGSDPEEHSASRKPRHPVHTENHINPSHMHAPLPPVAEIEIEDGNSDAKASASEERSALSAPVSERTSLLRSASTPTLAPARHGYVHHCATQKHSNNAVAEAAPAVVGAVPFFTGHHRYEGPGVHATHSAFNSRARRTPLLSGETMLVTAGSGTSVVDYFAVQPRSSAHSHSSHHRHHEADGELENGEGWDCPSDEHFDCERDGVEEDEDRCTEDLESHDVGKRRQVINTLVLQTGIMVHSLVIGLTLSIKSGPEFTSLVIAILFHQLFEGLSLGVRLAALAGAPARAHALAALFAAAVPIGGLLGRATLAHTGSGVGLQLTQGLMSALSAGTLIYAACVELLAADFVADPQLKRAPMHRQALALGSLLAGVAAMAALAMFD